MVKQRVRKTTKNTKAKKTSFLEALILRFIGASKGRVIETDLWLLMLMRSVLTIIFGGFVLIWPGINGNILREVVMLWLLAMGALDIFGGTFYAKIIPQWFLKVALGVVEVSVSVYLAHRGINITLLTLILALGLVLIFQGLVEIINSLKVLEHLVVRSWWIISALSSVATGLIVLNQLSRANNNVSFIWLLGLYGLIGGTLGLSASLAARHRN